MVIRWMWLLLAIVLLMPACSRREEPEAVQRQPAPLVVVKPKREVLSELQRKQLGFPEAVLRSIQDAAGAEAEPFFEVIESRSENLRGENGIGQQRLVGFSVRTTAADEVISSRYRALRRQGYLLFRSRQNYGSVPDVVTVIRGGSSYDIVRVQKTEAPGYRLTTRSIIIWLRERQKDCSFTITGAGQDFVEAQFLRQPADMTSFARKVISFAPDVLREGTPTSDKLAERMKRMNGFRLEWD